MVCTWRCSLELNSNGRLAWHVKSSVLVCQNKTALYVPSASAPRVRNVYLKPAAATSKITARGHVFLDFVTHTRMCTDFAQALPVATSSLPLCSACHQLRKCVDTRPRVTPEHIQFRA